MDITKLNLITDIKGLHKVRSGKDQSLKIGFIPTMGYLHEGHLSLIRQAKKENDLIIVSIFVNPAQFSQHEDLKRYPRDLNNDLKQLEKIGVNYVFTPAIDDIYPENYSTYIDISGPVTGGAESAFRPGHFKGVATIVLKLLNLTQPHNIYFGQKDAQQTVVIKKLINELNLSVNMRILPIIRHSDGLAMSSRNSLLSPEERKIAVILYNTLKAGMHYYNQDTSAGTQKIINYMKDFFSKEFGARLDYIQIREDVSFKEIEKIKPGCFFLIAAKIGRTRLIDNFLFKTDNKWETGITI